MNILVKSLSVAVLALSAAAATAAEPTAWEKIKTFAHGSKNDAMAEGRKMIAGIDQKMAELKKDIAKSSGDTRKAHEQNMAELQAKRTIAQRELDKMQASAAKTWDATKEGFSNAYKDLQEAYDKAAANAKSK